MQIRDPKAMRALAHPLRFELIELLGILGPATAAECARRLGTSQASCSFHLRQLAKYGFVEEAEPSGDDQRKRPWRLVDTDQSWSAEDHPVAAQELERVFVEREATRVLDFLQRREQVAEEWQRASFLSGVTAPMTSQEMTELRGALQDLLAPYAERLRGNAPAPEGAQWVRLFLTGVPLSEQTQRPDAQTPDAQTPDAP